MARPNRFPTRTLRPSGGKLYSMIFQNKAAGVPRNHFWSFTIPFKRLVYDGVAVRPSMTIEWITLSLRKWQELEGLKLKGRYGDDGVESSFYVHEHDYGARFSLEVLKRRKTSFLVRMSMEVEFDGVRRPTLPVRAESWLKYEGLIVPDELDRLKPNLRQAREIAGKFMDMEGYGAARERTFPPRT